MNTSTSMPAELAELLTKLTQQSDASRLVFSHLLVALSKAFFDPLIVLLDKVQQLRQSDLNPEQQKLCITQIQQSSSDLLALVNNLITFAQGGDATVEASSATTATETFSEAELAQLKDVRTLIIGDDQLRCEMTLKQLETFGLQCDMVTTTDALAVLRAAENEQNPYQIAVINAQHFDHHVAYLARTIKASPQLNHVMLTLALSTQLLGFEKERAYFGGFACIINLTRPQRLLTKLIKSWRGWSAKISFSRAEMPLHQNQNRILLVEDDPIPQKVTQRQLTELGYEVDLAPDGHMALKLLEQNQYGLVFMDVGLPDISGLEVTSEFRKRENSSYHTPIIGLTIYSMETDAQSGLAAGMDEYLTKPLMPNKLKEIVEQWVKK